MYDTRLIINGVAVGAADGGRFERANPVGRDLVTRSAAATVSDAEAAANAAAQAFPAWSKTSPAQRRGLLLAAEQNFHDRVGEITQAMQAELGASPAWAGFNVHLTCGAIREAASLVTQVAGQVIPSDIPGMLAMTQRRPVGVILSIAPWNAPIILAARAIAMPLACGNTVVLKGSELCPETHRLVVQCFIDAGLPKGVLNYIVNAPKDASAVVQALIAHKAVRRINFTGSSHVGRIIAGLAAAQLKPCLLELGGKAPMVVLDDADLDEAARAATFGAFMHSGQICMSTERVVVDNAIGDEFVRRFAARAGTLGVGDPRQSDAPLGPLSMDGAPEKIAALIDDAVAKGATLALKGTIDGQLVSPTILDHVTPEMRVYYEESFGPIAAVVRFSGGIEEAVAIANDTEYGLAAAVFGRDLTRAMAVADRIDAGSRHVNMATLHDQPQMAFGGVKASGYGRFNGLEAIYEFTDTCLLTVRSEPAPHYPF
jgi:acyl-CoA reductase-like NAD-dependent aldehyde dehydrogenase